MKRYVGGPEQETLPMIPLREQIEFQEIVQRSTNSETRRMLDWWAQPDDARVGETGGVLDQTLSKLWREDKAA